jgi:class 3 adenylate cyclase
MQREVRKTVSVVFSDVAGSTALAEQLDPESLRTAMTRYFAVARRVHQRHGGVVEKFIGDAVMAVFGIPHLHEDDALRAVRAAGELRDAMAALNRDLERELGVTLPVRTGVNTGLVLAGDEQLGHAFVSGDTVNVAARLQQAGRPGEVLLGEATLRLVADAVRVQPGGPLVLRGRSAPVAAYRLLEVMPNGAGLSRQVDTPLVGRAGELAVLERALNQAIDRRSCELVTVLGDPGVGKSRLLRAFAERAGERAVLLHTCCPPYGQATTAQVLGELIAQATATAPSDGLAWPVDLTAVPADPSPVFRDVRQLLQALAALRPVVVVLDDLQWAEPALLDLVEYLHAFTHRAAVLLVVVTRRQLLHRRPWWTIGPTATTLVVEPLPAAEATELAVKLRGPRGLDAAAAARMAAWAEGNPLFIEELLRCDGAHPGPVDGALGTLGQLQEWPLPPAVEALVGAELDCLPPEERIVLELASVVGRVFDWASVTALAPARLRPQLGAVLFALVRRNLIRVADRGLGTDAFTFRHRLLHDAAYRAVPKRERAILHVRVAERLAEATGRSTYADDPAVGHHLEQAYHYLAQLTGDELPAPTPTAAAVDRTTARLTA